MKSFKIYIVGESNSGKSSILSVLQNKPFTFNIAQTIGINYCRYQKNGQIYEIYDTSGLAQFEQLTINSMKNANLIILCFDISSKDAFRDVEKWLNIIQNSAQATPTVLVGNKTDKILQKKNRQIEELIQNYALYYTSARSPQTVKEMFNTVFESYRLLHDRVEIISKKKDSKGWNWLCLC
ncbi:unnamed protein product [Paramecium octaurelia]|uniref:Uncharacterized protein n=1 Tax=Paramecium octaurelia TaxID=43137 RepID=A0A8S1SC18_PAROT|nr:unnamed protein product [Paramecium octaurelia]